MEQPNNIANKSSDNNPELPKNNSNTSSHSKNLIFIFLGLIITIVLVLSVLFFISFKKSTQQNRATLWPEGPMMIGEPAIAIDFDPDTLNRKIQGGPVTVYIELPPGLDVKNISVSTVRLNGTVAALTKPTELGDHDGDGRPDLMVKFDTGQVIDLFSGQAHGDYEVEVTGEVGSFLFTGTGFVKVIDGVE